MTEERAVLAGGCFWGMQDLIRRYDGVISTCWISRCFERLIP
jgi:peptide-methionine (S)-S-oxide reductase